jgi:hypothetical protein
MEVESLPFIGCLPYFRAAVGANGFYATVALYIRKYKERR